MKKKVAISIGDLNGIGSQLMLENHEMISSMIEPIYCIDAQMLKNTSMRLSLAIPTDFIIINETIAPTFKIIPGTVSTESGLYSYESFVKATELARNNTVDAICTLPINKQSWEKAGITYKGHTDALRDFFDTEAIMMLGNEDMYVALFTEHIPLKDVVKKINTKDLSRFFIDYYHSIKPAKKVGVLGLNPHAGDGGVLGKEEEIIQDAIENAHKKLGVNIFSQPLVPDIAFTPLSRERYTHYIAMYHDQGLIPLKTLYFDESINVSLNLPILRTSVDHGTAFDIAYRGKKLSSLSYTNAIKYIADS